MQCYKVDSNSIMPMQGWSQRKWLNVNYVTVLINFKTLCEIHSVCKWMDYSEQHSLSVAVMQLAVYQYSSIVMPDTQTNSSTTAEMVHVYIVFVLFFHVGCR